MADIVTSTILPEEDSPQDFIPPTLAQLLSTTMAANNLATCVAKPAQVINYNYKNQSVTVQPYFDVKYRDGTVNRSPVIYNVPVCFQRSETAFISIPISPGDNVLLIFADRSLEKWLSSGDFGTPDDSRNHHISDAIAIPGLYPLSKPVQINNPNDIIVSNTGPKSRTELRVKPNGHLQILNQQAELVSTIVSFMQAVINSDSVGAAQALAKAQTFQES